MQGLEFLPSGSGDWFPAVMNAANEVAVHDCANRVVDQFEQQVVQDLANSLRWIDAHIRNREYQRRRKQLAHRHCEKRSADRTDQI